MNLDLTDDQAAVEELFNSFFERESPPSVVRASEALGFSPELWARMRATGAPAMSVGSAAGGGGAGLFDAVLAAEAAGRHLAPVPVAEHLVTARLLERIGARAALAAAVNASEPVTLALRPAGDTAVLVPAGAVAPSFVALCGDRLMLVGDGAPHAAVPNSAGLSLADRATAGGEVLAHGPEAVQVHAGAIDEWRLLMAAMLVGLADAALGLGVDYVCERHQFGAPIGSFQAVQHGMAEFPGPLSGARMLVRRAAWRADIEGPARLAIDASMALQFTTDLARTLTGRVLHYHGGYGVMEEYDIQLHYRRAYGWPAQLGSPAREAERLAMLLYDPTRVARPLVPGGE